MRIKNLILTIGALVICPPSISAQSAGDCGQYYQTPSSQLASPDDQGFIRRWTILEPIDKPNRSNTVFSDSYLRSEFGKEYFPGQMSVVPHDGDKVQVQDQELKWHHLESTGYNVQLLRFASERDLQIYGVLFWVIAVIDAPEDICDIRLAAGSNSASMWWLNGKEALILSGDRRMVMDDGMSKRLCLHSGTNILRGAIINGPGMSNFCVRFLKPDGQPVTNINIQ